MSSVTDGVLAFLMKEPRVALHYDELFGILVKGMLWLVVLPFYIWAELAKTGGLCPAELRSTCIAGGHIAFHFFNRRLLRSMAGYPGASCAEIGARTLRI